MIVVSEAILKEVNGEVVLEDPDAFVLIVAIGKYNCKCTLDLNSGRVEHFKNRMQELNETPKSSVIVILSVDDGNGKAIADILMPNYNWQEIRDRGERPFARGLARRDFMQEALEIIDTEAASKLKKSESVAVVVVDYGVAEIFEV